MLRTEPSKQTSGDNSSESPPVVAGLSTRNLTVQGSLFVTNLLGDYS